MGLSGDLPLPVFIQAAAITAAESLPALSKKHLHME